MPQPLLKDTIAWVWTNWVISAVAVVNGTE